MREVRATGDFLESSGARVTSFAALREALHAVLALSPGEQVTEFFVDIVTGEWSVTVDQVSVKQ